MKKKESADLTEMSCDELISKTLGARKLSKKIVAIVLACLVVPAICLAASIKGMRANSDGESLITFVAPPIAAASSKKDTISIPSGTVKANPFLPYRSIGGDDTKVGDVPQFDLIAPPEMIDESSEAARVMDTIVSGILYDKHSPSAILNIEGNDYLVKKGDTVNNYKVISIEQDSVTVKLGSNTFKAGIGEILTEGTLNKNDVSNLSSKFGGERR